MLTLALRICEDTFISRREYIYRLIGGSERTSHMCEQLSKTDALESCGSEEIEDNLPLCGLREDHNVLSHREIGCEQGGLGCAPTELRQMGGARVCLVIPNS